MRDEVHSIGFGSSIIIEDVPVDFKVTYNDTTLNLVVDSCDFDLVKEVQKRFSNLNTVLPSGSSPLSVAKLSGSIAKTDQDKKLSPTGDYRLITFNGELHEITIPIPIVSDIVIDNAYFYYQYLSAKAAQTDTSFKGQVIFLGCNLSVKPGTDLSKALTGAKLTSAYFMSNNASIVYFDFSGQINIGNIIKAIFGVSTPQLTIDVQSAGFFRIAKKNSTSVKQPGNKPPITDPGVTYIDALNQIANLQGKTPAPASDSNVGKLLPSSFPLGEKQVSVDGTTKVGIKVGKEIDTDFTEQFTQAFSGDDVTGICFWVMVDFNQIDLFKSLLKVGYDNGQVNSLVLYGFKTKKTDQQQVSTSAYFYAQLPSITLFNFLTLGGTNGRQGILFKYTTNNNQYELNGSIAFNAFSKKFLFDGDLVVNDDELVAVLDIQVGSPNSTIDAPLDMKGINFGELYLCLDKTFAKKEVPAKGGSPAQPAVAAKLDVTIGGLIDFTFSTGTKVQLNGNVVIEDSKPRLILVSLEANPMLTLSDFVQEVIKEPWQWVDDITKQIGFISGTMYYLSTEGVTDPSTYTFSYDSPLKVIDNSGSQPTTTNEPNALTIYKPGYHLKTQLVLFEKYVFNIELNVITGKANASQNGIDLSGSYGGTYDNGKVTQATKITAYFISLDSPVLSINTIGGSKFEAQIKDLELFSTPIGDISATYENGIFLGTYKHSSPNFGFAWQWTKAQGSGGFSITKIDGIDTQELNAVAQIVSKLNSLTGSGGCEQVVSSMFGQFKSSFTPSLQQGKSPTDNGNGTMKTPLNIEYHFTVAGANITSGSIPLTLDVSIPSSLSGLPAAIFETLGDNMGTIVEQLLESPTVYKAIALEMAKKGGAKLAARMLCRAAEDIAEELAEELSEALADGLIDAAIDGIVELGGVLTVVLAAGIAGAVGGLLGLLEKVWNAIKKIFGGDGDKKKAQNKLDSIKKPVEQLINTLNKSLDKVGSSIQIQSLVASIDKQANYSLDWNFPNQAQLGSGGKLEYRLAFLNGEVGSHSPASNIPAIPASGFTQLTATTYLKPWSSMIDQDSKFRMNASIQTSITGYEFLNASAKQNLTKTISTLNSIGNSLDGAVDFNNQLKAFLAKMEGYNKNGLTSDVVYASSDSAQNKFIIGQSILGINSKLDS